MIRTSYGDWACRPEDVKLVEQFRDEILVTGWDRAYFLPLFANIRLVSTTQIDTMAVDYLGNLYINMAFAEKLPVGERCGVFLHEVMHILMHHDTRRDGRHATRWNCAADRAINQFLRVCGIGLPDCALYPPMDHVNDGAEQLYEIEPEAQILITATAGCGVIDPLPGAPGTQTQASDDTTGKDDEQKVEIKNGVQIYRDTAGQIVAIQVSEDLIESVVRDMTDAAIRAQVLAAGTAAGAALAQLSTLPEPRVPWHTILHTGYGEAAATADREDTTYAKRSRRSTAQIIWPGWQAFSVMAAIIIDTSGSMSIDDIAEAVANTLAVVRTTQTKTLLVVHDVVVQWSGWITGASTEQEVITAMKGRGGTVFDAAYARVAEERGTFDVLIHLTDGGVAHWPSRPANVRRAIVALLGYAGREMVPPEYEIIDARIAHSGEAA